MKAFNERLFYVQDVRYVAVAWMRKSDDVQDVRYVAVAWMRKSDDVQDVRVEKMFQHFRHYYHPW